MKKKIKNIKVTPTLIAEVLLILGLIAIVIGFYLLNSIAGTFAVGISLLTVGYLLLKAEAMKQFRKGGG